MFLELPSKSSTEARTQEWVALIVNWTKLFILSVFPNVNISTCTYLCVLNGEFTTINESDTEISFSGSYFSC